MIGFPSAEVQAQSSEQLASYYTQGRKGLMRHEIEAYTRDFIQQMLHVEAVRDADIVNLISSPSLAKEIFARMIHRQAHQDYQDRHIARSSGDESPHTTGEKIVQKKGPNDAQPPPSSSASSSGQNALGTALQQCFARLNELSVQSQVQATDNSNLSSASTSEQSRGGRSRTRPVADATPNDATTNDATLNDVTANDVTAANDTASDWMMDEAASDTSSDESEVDTTPFLFEGRCKPV